MLIRSSGMIREGEMGKPYSMDLRERVVAAIEGGMSTRQAARRFAIGVATAGTWARLKRATGDVRPAKQGKPRGSVLDAHRDFILGVLAQAPDTTLDEMVERLREERAVTIVRTAVWKFLDRHGQTHSRSIFTEAFLVSIGHFPRHDLKKSYRRPSQLDARRRSARGCVAARASVDRVKSRHRLAAALVRAHGGVDQSGESVGKFDDGADASKHFASLMSRHSTLLRPRKPAPTDVPNLRVA
jgi:transposase